MDAESTRDLVRESLRGVIDPELGINVVDLGLVYDIAVDDGGVRVDMGVTTPTCPIGPHLVDAAQRAIRVALQDAKEVHVQLVRTPPWSPDRMSPAAKEQLGWNP